MTLWGASQQSKRPTILPHLNHSLTEYDARQTVAWVTIISMVIVFYFLLKWLRPRIGFVPGWAVTCVLSFLFAVLFSVLFSSLISGCVVR